MNSRGFIKTSLLIFLAMGLGLGLVSWLIRGGRPARRVVANPALLGVVVREEFLATVVESGDIDSSKNIEVRCKVKSQGRAGTAVLAIVAEGTQVRQGDFLVQLDDSLLLDQLTEQRIQVAEDKASVIQAQSDLDTAERVLEEYENGTYQQERATLEAEQALAEETLRRAGDYLNYSQTLNRKGYITNTQLEADRFAVRKAEKDLALATQKLELFKKFTRQRMIAEYRAEIEKQKANLEAARYRLELSELRQNELQEQIDSCHIVAPIDGQVIYANELDRGGDVSLVIEEGVLVRDGQAIIRLPDPRHMQVTAKVSESKIGQLVAGQKTRVLLEADREVTLAGVVRVVSPFPVPRRWFQAPVEYEVFVDILESHPALRPGLRGKVEIIVEQIADAIQAPLSALVREGERYFVLVHHSGGMRPQEVTVGPTNVKSVVIESGLEPGEEVVLNPEQYWDEFRATLTP